MAYQRLSVQHPQVLGDSFWSQGDCTDHFVEENLSPNSHSLTAATFRQIYEEDGIPF